MKEWLQSLAVYALILSICMELMPKGNFIKYMKLIGGFIWILIFFQGIIGNQYFDPKWYSFYQEHRQELVGPESEKEKIRIEYKKQIEQQIQNLLEEEGYEVSSVTVELEGTKVDKIEVSLEHSDAYEKANVKNKLNDVYSGQEVHINIKS